MPVLKPISGHTSAAPAMRYLTKQNRALAADCSDNPARFGLYPACAGCELMPECAGFLPYCADAEDAEAMAAAVWQSGR